MSYSEEVLGKIALFHQATILMVKLKDENRTSEKLNDFCASFGKELAFDKNINIEDICSADKFSHIKLTDEQIKFLQELIV